MTTTERFDRAAASWDEKPRRVRLAQVIAGAIGSAVPLCRDMTGLEYGCGTGLVTLALAEQVGLMYGLDSSGGMIAVLEDKISALEVTNVTAFHGRLQDRPTVPLDLIIMSMTLHHIEESQELLAQCYDRLQPGGFLAVADLEAEDGSFHGDNDGIAHFGFDPDVLHGQMVQCGFSRGQAQTIYTIGRNDHQYPVFLLTATKG